LFRGRSRELGLAVLVLVAFYAGYAVLAVLVTRLGERVAGPGGWGTVGRGLVAASAPALLAMIGVYLGLVRFGRWTGVRLRIQGGAASVRWLAVGLVWGVGLALLVLGLSVAGGARLIATPGPEAWLSVAAPVGLGLALAALLEELLFRGFPLVRLADVTGRLVASVALTLLFVAAHWANPLVSALGFVNIGLASLLLSAVFFSPGGLPAAVGLHFGWNAGLALMADAPVSGLQLRLPAVEYAPGPREWWTGGTFGPEGGVAAGLVFLGALAWWWRRGFRAEVAV
jgi:membrane protease YdiL (CAAX protease family)